jgi:hypothetical protein
MERLVPVGSTLAHTAARGEAVGVGDGDADRVPLGVGEGVP